MKRPASQWYWADWLRDPAIRASSLEARGLWMDMLALMHEGDPYGHLTVGGEAVSDVQLARMVGESPGRLRRLLTELEAHGVFSRTGLGVIFSRRMVKDEERREFQAVEGKKGGSPNLGVEYNVPGFVYAMRRDADGAVKIGISVQPVKRLYKVRQQFSSQVVDLIATLAVDDMGATESELHALFKPYCLSGGEWFRLPDPALEELLLRLNAKDPTPLKGTAKGKAPPSSSSSSASPIPPRRGGWVGRFGDAWTHATKGIYPLGQLGRELKGLIDRDGEEKVYAAWLAFLDSDQRKFGGAYFAKHYGNSSGDVKPRLVGVGGDLSPDELRNLGIKL